MNKFSELPELNYDQIQFVDSRMYPWGSWINEGRLDKPELNILYKLMKSVEPQDEPSPVICSDELGMAISEDIEMFFKKYDERMHFILFSYYVHRLTVNRIATKLREREEPQYMQPCNGKRDIRIPCLKTCKRRVEKDLALMKAIIYDILIKIEVKLAIESEKRKNIKKIRFIY